MEIVEMIPGELYASGAIDTDDSSKNIRDLRITAIMNLRTIKDNPPEGFPMNHLLWAPLSMLEFPTIHWLNQVTDVMFRVMQQGHRLLVHCNLGKHRTGLVITAYYMRRYRLSPDHALAKARQRKPDLYPPFHFMAALYQFEKHLRSLSLL